MIETQDRNLLKKFVADMDRDIDHPHASARTLVERGRQFFALMQADLDAVPCAREVSPGPMAQTPIYKTHGQR